MHINLEHNDLRHQILLLIGFLHHDTMKYIVVILSIFLLDRKTLQARKVSATSGAASVPDEVFHRAKGVQLCNTQAHQCTPAYFADSYFLNKFSSEVIAERAHVPPTARVICERHTISVVPVTRVTMNQGSRSFSFYIIGTSREVYLKDSYPSTFCWGLCPCLEWLKLQLALPSKKLVSIY